MAFWDRIRNWFSGGSSGLAQPAGVAGAEAAPELELDPVEDEPLELDIDPDGAVPELMLDDDEPGSLDSIDAIGRAHLELPNLIDDDEVTELGVDPDSVRARMRRKDPMFPDDEVTEVTWLDSLSTADDEPTHLGLGDDPDSADELPIAPLPDELDENRFVEGTVPLPDDSDLEPTTLLVADESNIGLPPPLLVADETRVGEPLLVADETNVAPPAAVVEETFDSVSPEEAEVTDFHLDMLAWDEDEHTDGEAMPPPPAPTVQTGPRFRNTLRIADGAVLQALRLEHYPDCDAVPDEMLHRLARCDEALLRASRELGAHVESTIEDADDDELLDSAMLFAGVRTEPEIKDARAALMAQLGARQQRRLGWAAAAHARLVVEVVGDATLPGLAGALARFEDALTERDRLLDVGPEVLSTQVDPQPIDPVGLHSLDGFAWLD